MSLHSISVLFQGQILKGILPQTLVQYCGNLTDAFHNRHPWFWFPLIYNWNRSTIREESLSHWALNLYLFSSRKHLHCWSRSWVGLQPVSIQVLEALGQKDCQFLPKIQVEHSMDSVYITCQMQIIPTVNIIIKISKLYYKVTFASFCRSVRRTLSSPTMRNAIGPAWGEFYLLFTVGDTVS